VGALVIEHAELLPRGKGEFESLRFSGGLCLREGPYHDVLPLLHHVFAAGPVPDLQSARVDFLLNGAAYQWHGDFSLGREELTNRTSGSKVTGRAAIENYMATNLQAALHARAAAFTTPPPEVPGRDFTPSAEEPPPSESLAQELARYEDSLNAATGAHDTATALYADLFPLLEAQEEASRKLIVKVKQLERHYQAETAITEFRRLESSIQERITASRQAHQVEKQIAEYEKDRDRMSAIDESLLGRAESQRQEVETVRQTYIASEKVRKESQAHYAALRPLRWWISTAAAIPVLVAPAVLPLPYAEYIWTFGAILMMSFPLAAFTTLRKRSLHRTAHRCHAQGEECRRDLELAELSYRQMLMPFEARDVQHLREKFEAQAAWHAAFNQATQELAHLRKISGTDDTLKIHSAKESAELAELEQRCRELAPYRLSEADRQNVEQMVQDLEGEARCQKEAAGEIRAQCEHLAAGWADLPLLSERVSALRLKLAEWRRWETAFRRIREVVDHLPQISDLAGPGPEVRASAYLARLTAGRWTRLQYDLAASEFKLFDEQSGLWIHADRENPAFRSTVDLAYRLCLIEDETLPLRLPVWISEPFDELPDAMSTACAGLLAEVAQRRQVVLLCRQVPQVRWPEGAGLETR
jgi:hypothetical protein